MKIVQDYDFLLFKKYQRSYCGLMKKPCKRCQKIIEVIGNTKYCSECAPIVIQRKRLVHQDRDNVNRIIKLEYQLELYEKMFKAQDDMLAEKDNKINELKSDNERLKKDIDKLQNQHFDNVSLYAKRIISN